MKFCKVEFEKYVKPYKLLSTNTNKVYLRNKRFFDIVFSLLSIIILSPLLLIITLVVYLDDRKASPIFVQKRVGAEGKEFNFYKFRSMCDDAEDKLADLHYLNEVEGPVFKIKDDPRITRIGRFIRNNSMDELPQLLNVLKGEMSIVGPRPPIPREIVHYDSYSKQRLLTKPGLTCFWQVSLDRHSMVFEDWVALDIKYAEEQSAWIDAKLIFRTIKVLANGNTD